MIQNDLASRPGRRNFEERLESRLGFYGDDAVLLLSVNVDGIQHREEQLPAFDFIGLLPEPRQFFQELPCGGRGIHLRDHQLCQLLLQSPLLPLVPHVVVMPVDIGLPKPPEFVLGLRSLPCDALDFIVQLNLRRVSPARLESSKTAS